MTDSMTAQTVCIRCGYVNQSEIGLTGKKDEAVYRCENCKFIVLTTWMEEID